MKSAIWMHLSLMAVAAVLGFFVGQRTERSGGEAGGSGEGMRGASGRGGLEDRISSRLLSGRERSGRNLSPEAKMQIVMEHLKQSPMVMMDFDTMFEAYDVLRDMTPEEVQAALAEVERSDANQQVKMMMQMMLINRWAKTDGQGAVAFAMEQKQPQLKMMGLMGGLMGWIKTDPDGAYAWYEENRETAGTGMMMGGGLDGMFFNAFAQRDVPGAFERLSKLDKRGQKAALNSMANSVGNDPIKRAEFVEGLKGLEDETVARDAMQNMVRSMAWQAPEDAVEFLEAGEWTEEERSRLERTIAQGWGNMDPEAAIEWQMKSLEEGEETPEQVGTTFGSWVRNDPKGAEAWLAELPEERRPDSLYRSAADQLRWSEDFSRSMNYAMMMEDADQRTNKVREVYQAWNSYDRDQADGWLEGMDEETQKAVLASDAPSGEQPGVVEEIGQ